MATVSGGSTSERFGFIARYGDELGVRYLCDWLGVSRSGYYAWLTRAQSARAKDDEVLFSHIGRIFEKSRGTYGSPRVHAVLQREGIAVSRKRVARLMREGGLQARCVRVYPRVPGLYRFFYGIENKRHDLPKPSGVNQQWAGDLTYIRHRGKWVHLAVVLDLYSRRIVGWAMSKKKDVSLTGTALLRAIRKRRPDKGLIFHTDRGSEYRSYKVQAINERYGLVPSMNRPGQCTDNAEVESFFHSLKSETIKDKVFETERQLRETVSYYINHFYNRTRLHSALGYCSPVEYEAR